MPQLIALVYLQTSDIMDSFKSIFSDILAELSDEGDKEAQMIEILETFEESIIDWMKYHEDQAKKYGELHRRFLTRDYKWELKWNCLLIPLT